MNERDKYIRRVFETALFFRDMYEEKNDGNTNAIKLLKPIKTVSNTTVRKFVLHECYQKKKLSLTETALQLASFSDNKTQLPFDVADIEKDLKALCSDQEREMRAVTDNEIKKRSFLRAARYIQRIKEEDVQAHSRVVEIFIPDDFVPWGRGDKGPGHREHVVPCVYLRDKCLDLFQDGATLSQAADYLQRHVVIIEITKVEQKKLDGGIKSGGMGLKNRMPDDWNPDTGCIFQRLHKAEIKFQLPNGFSPCNH